MAEPGEALADPVLEARVDERPRLVDLVGAHRPLVHPAAARNRMTGFAEPIGVRRAGAIAVPVADA